MSCQNCNGPSNCCYLKAKEIKAFKKHVLSHFILEVIFEMIISVSSVVTDFLTLIIYLNKRKWILAVLTFIPVLLPTTVFTNVYLSDAKERISLSGSSRSTSTELYDDKPDVESQRNDATDPEQENDGTRCCGCFSAFCLSMCHNDKTMRKRTSKMMGKYVNRSAKYFFGTFVLRVIAWTWYLKALVFGYKAYREPKRFMRMQSPNEHWSHELLLRLDFLQAALENAPQCVIQLYALLVDTDENKTLGILTLVFSFLDFIRVTTTVHWNIVKGPVEAPENVYGSFTWRALNMTSWILLYVARCSAIAVLVASSDNWGAVIAFGVFALHMCLFAKLFSSTKYGVAAQKIIVTAFISLFFLPELDVDSLAVDKLVQFYYAVLLMENTCFIIPWNGLDADYCDFFSGSGSRPGPRDPTGPTVGPRVEKVISSTPWPWPFSGSPSTVPPQYSGCLLQPEVVVVVVASFTVLGVILRLAAARKSARHQATLSAEETPTTMQEKIANIYSRSWTRLTLNDLVNSFMQMLRKEVIIPEPATKDASGTALQKNPNCSLHVSPQLATHFTASQNFIKKSCSMIIRSPTETKVDTRRFSYCPSLISPTTPYMNGSVHLNNNNHQEIDDNTRLAVPKLFFVPALPSNTNTMSTLSVSTTSINQDTPL